MTCLNCKNPIQDGSVECEWCGTNFHGNHQDEINPNKTILRFIYDGINGMGNAKILIFINGLLTKQSTLKEGIIFEISNTHVIPLVQIKMENMKKVRLETPKLDIHKNYLITIDFSIWWGFKSIPKSIEEI